ncbi:DUF881 domain-containing protein [Alkalihalobacillus trypoxylicola]|uniref:NgoFVII family restriction endonuclease n=1 Tax=Alkalihalobacillus trypoxylicola TaxID=519424 RepID=A0A162FAR1_9BACI|nr:DUF881 domain-containing protein [Alkalihalobacillus trypoxylicola]KYG35171.1 hypothetical protein AZF04_02205 [Alkalihalobacillus trypoxylicola]
MKRIWIFTFITFMVGFMISIQYSSTQSANTIRDTRDVRELRDLLNQEQNKRQFYNQEIEKLQTLLAEYETTLHNHEDVVTVLENQLDDLKATASLTEYKGNGVVIRIEPVYEEPYVGENEQKQPSPELFRFLVNELNFFGAKEMSIAEERFITTSAFRDVNGDTQLNSRRLPPLPFDIKVIHDNPERLHNELLVSNSLEEFEMAGFSLSIQIEEGMVLPAYEGIPRVRYMEEVKGE